LFWARRAELFYSAQKNYEKNTCGITVKKLFEKDAAQIRGNFRIQHQASLYSVTVTRRDHMDLTLREIF
jgi:carbonic anhydrase/acetyltransferase-like protein (isoleucine patch superfamily)